MPPADASHGVDQARLTAPPLRWCVPAGGVPPWVDPPCAPRPALAEQGRDMLSASASLVALHGELEAWLAGHVLQ